MIRFQPRPFGDSGECIVSYSPRYDVLSCTPCRRGAPGYLYLWPPSARPRASVSRAEALGGESAGSGPELDVYPIENPYGLLWGPEDYGWAEPGLPGEREAADTLFAARATPRSGGGPEEDPDSEGGEARYYASLVEAINPQLLSESYLAVILKRVRAPYPFAILRSVAPPASPDDALSRFPLLGVAQGTHDLPHVIALVFTERTRFSPNVEQARDMQEVNLSALPQFCEWPAPEESEREYAQDPDSAVTVRKFTTYCRLEPIYPGEHPARSPQEPRPAGLQPIKGVYHIATLLYTPPSVLNRRPWAANSKSWFVCLQEWAGVLGTVLFLQDAGIMIREVQELGNVLLGR